MVKRCQETTQGASSGTPYLALSKNVYSFGSGFSRAQFNTERQKKYEDQLTLGDYQRSIPKSRSAVGQKVVEMVKDILKRNSQPY
ncbi:hypothetical protein AYI68_g995 [Smittium mucronatum]|uniref:Uncharacterized protein n=1 Tax=Smittium mucronatum TaxID=133383 RepID=A0A1R0H6I9_9FUNG|nr:hypothetical protein AYI68_g995 [Smittium mucronatum]